MRYFIRSKYAWINPTQGHTFYTQMINFTLFLFCNYWSTLIIWAINIFHQKPSSIIPCHVDVYVKYTVYLRKNQLSDYNFRQNSYLNYTWTYNEYLSKRENRKNYGAINWITNKTYTERKTHTLYVTGTSFRYV